MIKDNLEALGKVIKWLKQDLEDNKEANEKNLKALYSAFGVKYAAQIEEFDCYKEAAAAENVNDYLEEALAAAGLLEEKLFKALIEAGKLLV